MSELRPDLLELIRPWLLPARRVDVRPLSGSDAAGVAKFAGSPARPADLPWPKCSSCESPLDFVAQFPAMKKFWRLFVCETCCPWSDRERQAGLARLEFGPLDEADLPPQHQPHPSRWAPHAWVFTDVLSPPLQSDFGSIPAPPKEYVDWLEEQESQEEAEDDETARVFESWGAWAGVQSQVGGYAHFIQDAPAVPPCAECGQPLELLARLDSEDDVGIMWGDLGAVYLHACPSHPHAHHYELQCF